MYSLNKYLSILCHSPEEDGTTVDVIMVFQFPSAESSAVRNRKIRSILDEKIRNTRALLINTSSVEVNGKQVPFTEKAMAPHSSTLAWKIPWMEGPGGLQSMGSLEMDMTERLHFHFSLSCTGEGNGNPLQCSCLENPREGGAWWLPSMGSHRVGHD